MLEYKLIAEVASPRAGQSSGNVRSADAGRKQVKKVPEIGGGRNPR